jgi:hypothetical protein
MRRFQAQAVSQEWGTYSCVGSTSCIKASDLGLALEWMSACRPATRNFLGSGAVGVKPFGVISYSARISPHAVIGYEKNGQSLLVGNFVGTPTNTKGSLPRPVRIYAGADVAIVKRLTGAFDFYGQRLFGVPQLFSTQYTDLGHCSNIACSTLTLGTAHPDLGVRPAVDYNILNASIGLKYRLWRNLVVTGNVLVKLDDNGLRSTTVPLVGASYNF